MLRSVKYLSEYNLSSVLALVLGLVLIIYLMLCLVKVLRLSI